MNDEKIKYELKFVKGKRSCNQCVIEPDVCSANERKISPCANIRKKMGDGHFIKVAVQA